MRMRFSPWNRFRTSNNKPDCGGMKHVNKIIEYGILLFVFLIPWQARWIISIGKINGREWEYGTQSLYATEIILGVILIAIIFKFIAWAIETRQCLVSTIWKRFNFKRLLSPAGALFLLIIWAGISIFWAIDKNTALIHWRFLVEAGAVFVLMSSFFRAAERDAPTGPSVQEKIKWAIIISAVVQVIFAVGQSNMQYIPASTELGMALQQAGDLGTSVVETVSGRWLRAYGTFPHPNILGGWLVLALIITIRKIQETSQRLVSLWPTRYKQIQISNIQLLFLYSSFAIILFGLLLTFSRAAWLGFGVFLAIVILSHPTPRLRAVNWIRSRLVPRSFSEGGRIPVIVHETPRQARGDGLKILVLTILTIAIFAFTFSDPFFSRFSSNRLEVKSQTERVASWREGIEIIKKHPLLGVGIGNYGLAVHRDIDNAQPAWYYQPAHNVFLLIWSELGFIGILIIVILLYCYIVGSVRGTSAVIFLLPLFTLAIFDHYLWSLYPGMMLGAVYLGLILAKNRTFLRNLT